MVSSALEMSEAELQRTLARLRVDCAADSDYAMLRQALPEDWPL